MSAAVPFQPLGEKPEWRLVYDILLQQAQPGDVISYAQLDRVLGRPFIANRSPLYRARKELGEAQHRWLDPVLGVGYRVIEAAEHVMVARRHKRKSQRQMGTALEVVGATDVTRLTDEQRTTFDQLAMILHLQHSMLLSHEKRLTRVEGLLRQAGME